MWWAPMRVEDARVLRADGLGPDLGDADVDQVARDEDGRLERCPDPHDGGGEVARAELVERAGVGGVRLDDGKPLRPPFDEVGVAFDGEYLDVEVVEGVGERRAEASEPDDEDAVCGVLVSQ